MEAQLDLARQFRFGSPPPGLIVAQRMDPPRTRLAHQARNLLGRPAAPQDQLELQLLQAFGEGDQ
jgi:hypothetical protein